MPVSRLPNRIVVDSLQALATSASAWIAESVFDAVSRRGTCSIALSGGKTPQPVHAALSHHVPRLPWSKIHIFFADERAVLPTDPDSNYRMARESLLDHVPVPPANVHRMEGERADLDAAARAYDALLPRTLDVLLLGVGPDGHTASLFPGAPALGERAKRVVPADSPFPPPRRLTITPPVIATARQTAVIVAGHDKAAVVQRALEGPVNLQACPVQLALDATWFIERSAAALFERALR